MKQQSGSGTRGRILVIDDDPSIRQTLHIALAKAGYDVLEARAHSPSPPVIAMTDGGRTKNLNPLSHAELMGAVRTIAKPFTLEKMLAAVEQSLA
jgi:DNA-binding NtrC family response regulator